MKRGIYLGSYKAHHPNHNIIYQDINGERDLDGDMMDIINNKDLGKYDFIISLKFIKIMTKDIFFLKLRKNQCITHVFSS